MKKNHAKKPESLDLKEWQDFLDEFKKDPSRKYAFATPIAMRIENTQLSLARYSGGCVYNKVHYKYFEPKIPDHAPNEDGSPYVAWLIVREDFLKWVKKQLRQKAAEAVPENKQEELF